MDELLEAYLRSEKLSPSLNLKCLLVERSRLVLGLGYNILYNLTIVLILRKIPSLVRAFDRVSCIQ